MIIEIAIGVALGLLLFTLLPQIIGLVLILALVAVGVIALIFAGSYVFDNLNQVMVFGLAILMAIALVILIGIALGLLGMIAERIPLFQRIDAGRRTPWDSLKGNMINKAWKFLSERSRAGAWLMGSYLAITLFSGILFLNLFNLSIPLSLTILPVIFTVCLGACYRFKKKTPA